jgi:hypothetical protein
VDQNVKTAAQERPKFLARLFPFLLETGAGHIHIDDGEMVPAHVAVSDGFAHAADLQRMQLVGFDERHNGRGPPARDRIEIDMEISTPRAGHRSFLAFARAEGDANAPQSLSDAYLCYLKRMADAGSHSFSSPPPPTTANNR